MATLMNVRAKSFWEGLNFQNVVNIYDL